MSSETVTVELDATVGQIQDDLDDLLGEIEAGRFYAGGIALRSVISGMDRLVGLCGPVLRAGQGEGDSNE